MGYISKRRIIIKAGVMNLYSDKGLDKQLAKTDESGGDDLPDLVQYDNDNPRKVAFLEALRMNMGNISKSADTVGISRWLVYKWKQNDEEFAVKLYEQEERVKDWVESKLLRLIKSDNTAATIFFMKTKAKDRGYSERWEEAMNNREGANSNPNGFTIEVVPISIETIEHAKNQS
jgi:hypothetical protein